MASATSLEGKKCLAFGTAPALSDEQLGSLKAQLHEGWRVRTVDGCQRIARDWSVRDFVTGLAFFQSICTIAEEEGHHPDLHLVGYKHVTVELWTHTTNGLSENDFIVAYRIDRLPPPAAS